MDSKVLNRNVYDIQKCEICFQPLTQDLVAMKCSHVAHEVCLTNWSTRYNYCPICHEEFQDKNFLKINYHLQQKESNFENQIKSYVNEYAKDDQIGSLVVSQQV